MLKTKNGITLIALIITIIVLLILAGTTISLIVGDNGILQKSQTAKLNTEIGQEKEFVGIAYSGAKTKKVAQGDYTSVKGIELDAELQANGVDARAEGDDPIIVTFNISRRQYIIDGTGNVLPSDNVSEPNIDFNSVMEEARQNRIGDEEIGIGTDGSIVNMGLWTYTQDDEKKTINLQGDSGSIISPAYIGDIVDGRIIGAVPQYIMPEGSNEFYTVTAMEAGLIGIKNLIYAPEIPETVVDMTDTFSSCSNLINMPELPPGIQNMQGAFSYCTSLTDIVTIPNSIQNLNGTFRNCTGLTNITVDIPNTTSPLSMVYTFEDCSNLVNAPVLSNNTTELFGTFDGCTSLLEPPIIPEGVTSIGQIFDGCTSLRTAPAIPEGVINMNYAFADCTSITAAPEIPSSVIMMSSAFLNCSNLTGDLVINTNSIQSYNAIYGTGYADCLKGTSTNANCDLKLTGAASTTTLNTILNTKSPDSHLSLK